MSCGAAQNPPESTRIRPSTESVRIPNCHSNLNVYRFTMSLALLAGALRFVITVDTACVTRVAVSPGKFGAGKSGTAVLIPPADSDPAWRLTLRGKAERCRLNP
jgi:hypothetical protein